MPKMNKELADIIKEAYRPCESLKNSCACGKNGIVWNPEKGHVPRGFCGATGEIKDIKLVLVLAEPGTPGSKEHYDKGDIDSMLEQHNKYVTFENNDPNQEKTSLFHKNIRRIVTSCFPNIKDFEEVKKHAWITESVLCSVPPVEDKARFGKGQNSTGTMPKEVEDECGKRYLLEQYKLLKDACWVAVGCKARNRLKSLGINCRYIFHPSPPGYNVYKTKADESWDAFAKYFLVNYGQREGQDEP